MSSAFVFIDCIFSYVYIFCSMRPLLGEKRCIMAYVTRDEKNEGDWVSRRRRWRNASGSWAAGARWYLAKRAIFAQIHVPRRGGIIEPSKRQLNWQLHNSTYWTELVRLLEEVQVLSLARWCFRRRREVSPTHNDLSLSSLGLCESSWFSARVLCRASYRILEYSVDTGSGYWL